MVQLQSVVQMEPDQGTMNREAWSFHHRLRGHPIMLLSVFSIKLGPRGVTGKPDYERAGRYLLVQISKYGAQSLFRSLTRRIVTGSSRRNFMRSSE